MVEGPGELTLRQPPIKRITELLTDHRVPRRDLQELRTSSHENVIVRLCKNPTTEAVPDGRVQIVEQTGRTDGQGAWLLWYRS
jgi:hypothetical protein